MTNVTPKQSPATRGKPSVQFSIHEDQKDAEHPSDAPNMPQKYSMSSADGMIPLVSGKLQNVSSNTGRSASHAKKLKTDHTPTKADLNAESDGMSTLLAKLSEQQALLETQRDAADITGSSSARLCKEELSSASVPPTPATESFATTPPTEDDDDDDDDDHAGKVPNNDGIEMERLKRELNAAKSMIARKEQELSHARAVKEASDQAKQGAPGVGDHTGAEGVDRTIVNLQDDFGLSRPMLPYGNQDDARSDISEALSAGALNHRGPGIWTPASSYNNGMQGAGNVWNPSAGRSWVNRPMAPPLQPIMIPPQQQMRAYSGASSPVSNVPGKMMSDFNPYQANNGNRRQNLASVRSASVLGHNRGMGWESYGNPGEAPAFMGMNPAPFQPMGMFQAPVGYQPRPIGTPLSPTAAEFTANGAVRQWNPAQPSSPGQTYVSPMEPLNYRRLLDRSVTCNWKYIVDKIVCNNDQQASIFLQQKLKVGTAEQKFEIVEAIVAQAYPLMVNRFGNFLVQRCFEHGTPDQVIAIANAIRGNTLSLSMDAFGCHVVQKAFDAVPEEYKAIMVHELLRRIPETVIHRYACHVWQKLFELRWSDSPPQIMKYVNEALRGMWHEVALGETGSLVVQNIFENCLEEDKRPCIDEVLQSIDIVAHGQFGNWCIQHICEHGAPADRSRAIDHVLRYATEYSMDQFASKVVEKCLKIGGTEFLERYLERVCEGRPDRPRIPLIDISSDQYGNYLIQYILTHANAQHREVVASHIRKHMVSLRGSKFGSRVGLLCCNPAYATRPGPTIGPGPTRFNGGNNNGLQVNRFGGSFR